MAVSVTRSLTGQAHIMRSRVRPATGGQHCRQGGRTVRVRVVVTRDDHRDTAQQRSICEHVCEEFFIPHQLGVLRTTVSIDADEMEPNPIATLHPPVQEPAGLPQGKGFWGALKDDTPRAAPDDAHPTIHSIPHRDGPLHQRLRLPPPCVPSLLAEMSGHRLLRVRRVQWVAEAGWGMSGARVWMDIATRQK